jgi:AAA+ ATPase superfamily predicted ATPase
VATDPLVGRETEFAGLQRLWRQASRGEPQLVVLWGRRRVGKTFLLSHFTRGLNAVFFGATQQSESIELRRLGEAVRRDLGSTAADLAGAGFGTWEAALRWFAAQAQSRPLALVLDEVPYLLKSTPGFASIVQVVWDHLPRGTKLMLVLTGSSVGVIEGMLGEGGPLRGRPTWARRLDPLDLRGARRFLPRLAPDRLLEAYAACGGYPLHLRAWNPRAALRQNLLQLALSPGGLLLADAASMLAEELGGAQGYSRILAAVGRGRTRFGEIASEAGQRVEVPLELLVRAGFLRRAVPVGAPKAAKPLYELGDPYLAFWFSYLYASQTEIESGQGEALLARLAPLWQRHVGWVFEEQARAHASRLVASGELPKRLVTGRWWAHSGQSCEVDVLGLEGAQTALLGEARWQDDPLGLRDVAELKAKLARVPSPVEHPLLALWGKRGVAKEALRAGALGFDLEKMLAP